MNMGSLKEAFPLNGSADRELLFLNQYLPQIALRGHQPSSIEAFGEETVIEERARVNRLQQMESLWKEICTANDATTSKTKVCYFHASPGMGKTFLLKCLIERHSIPDNYQSLAENVHFLPIRIAVMIL